MEWADGGQVTFHNTAAGNRHLGRSVQVRKDNTIIIIVIMNLLTTVSPIMWKRDDGDGAKGMETQAT
ncbi:hypothetical protein ASPFODRAFT_41631 [Aspergillus luchuensis CBS 106.47]|uniref:Uncharacterized protein n=1 Tax=Aspergillus luchuensis (strain CBS 106.47) TaxID=1137211 RepID=A0A1M3TWW2_ASPLC|nr:hypothetical protein ASPFODRAFT_41631 [Aspergillus luchuensis CBS 106.47]